MSKKTRKIHNDEDVATSRDSSEEKKKNTSLRLNKTTLKALKIKAIEEDTSVQSLIERLIKDYLDKPG